MKILVSPGYGAGWSTWADDKIGRYMLTYQPIIDFIESGGDVKELDGQMQFPKDKPGYFVGHPLLEKLCEDIKERFGEDAYSYFGGADDLVVVETGDSSFRVNEYDGYESVEYRDNVDWIN